MTNLTRQVTLTGHFFMQATEVTQGEWLTLMGNNPASRQACGDTCPVEQVDWHDAVAYANAKSTAEGLPPCYDGMGGLVGGATPYACAGYRLPTEAEWEYACRAGTQTPFYWGEDEGEAGEHAWFYDNADLTPHPVGSKLPNAWGLYDMVGNVFEWVHDRFADYPDGAVTDPWTPLAAESRVIRGGAWDYGTVRFRSAFRAHVGPDFRFVNTGLRLARSGVP